MNRFIRQKLAEIEKNQRSDYRLGYSFEPKGLSIAPNTLANFLERKTQLYEQGATVRRIGQYVSYVTRLFSAQAVHLVFLTFRRALRQHPRYVLRFGPE